MSLAPQHISVNALRDMLELFNAQPWLSELHEEMVELWNICASREEQVLLKNLLNGFCMLDAQKERAACEAIAQKIQSLSLDPKSTWIIATANKEEVDGSTAGLQKLKNKIQPIESWHPRLLGNIPASVGKVKSGDKVFLFDDFIGSGGTMIKKRNWLLKLLLEAGVDKLDVSFLSFSGMRFGIQNIKDTTGADVFSHHILLKGISERFPPEEVEEMKKLMLRLESILGKNYKKKKIEEYSFGYEKSESLYCGQNDNCPNNVFPILWWPYLKSGEDFKVVLKRAG